MAIFTDLTPGTTGAAWEDGTKWSASSVEASRPAGGARYPGGPNEFGIYNTYADVVTNQGTDFTISVRNVVVGNSPASNSTAALTLGGGASGTAYVTVAAGCELRHKGSIQWLNGAAGRVHTLEIAAGATLTHDNGGNPTWQYGLRLGSGGAQNYCRLKTSGTNSTRARITSDTSGGGVRGYLFAWPQSGQFELAGLRWDNYGEAGSGGFGINMQQLQAATTWVNVDFDNCAGPLAGSYGYSVLVSGSLAAGSLTLTNVRFINTTRCNASLSYFGAGTITVNGSHFDKPSSTTPWAAGSKGNSFIADASTGGVFLSDTPAGGWAMESLFIYNAHAASTGALGPSALPTGTWYRAAVVRDTTGQNPGGWGPMTTTAAPSTYDTFVYQAMGSGFNSSDGDGCVTGALSPASPITITLVRVLSLPAGLDHAGSSGTLLTAGTSANLTFNVSYCTAGVLVGPGGSYISVAEGPANSAAINLFSCVAYRTTAQGAGSGFMLSDSGSGASSTAGKLTADHNLTIGLTNTTSVTDKYFTPTPFAGFGSRGLPASLFTTTPGTGDLVIPGTFGAAFVDPTRDFATYAVSKLGAGKTIADLVVAVRDRNQPGGAGDAIIDDCIDWIRAGWALTWSGAWGAARTPVSGAMAPGAVEMAAPGATSVPRSARQRRAVVAAARAARGRGGR